MFQEPLHQLHLKGKGQLHLVLTFAFLSYAVNSTWARALADANQESAVVISVRFTTTENTATHKVNIAKERRECDVTYCGFDKKRHSTMREGASYTRFTSLL